MFDSLDDQIRLDENRMTSSRDRMIRWVLVTLVSVTVFGGLYMAVRFMQG